MHKQRIAILAAAGLGLLGMILPWASIWIISQNGFNSGWAGWGTLAGLGGAIGIVLKDADKKLPLDAQGKKLIMGCGGAAAFCSLMAMIIFKANGMGVITLGIGVFICLLAGAAILAIPFVIKGDGNMSMPTKDSIKDDLK